LLTVAGATIIVTEGGWWRLWLLLVEAKVLWELKAVNRRVCRMADRSCGTDVQVFLVVGLPLWLAEMSQMAGASLLENQITVVDDEQFFFLNSDNFFYFF
jgi:hypothetical protein